MPLPFTVGCGVVGAATPRDASSWDAVLSVANFGAYDVQVGDVVFLDMYAGATSPGLVARYRVKTILNQTGLELTATLEWFTAGDPIDPTESTGYYGYISRASKKNGLVWHPTPQLLGLEPRVVDGARSTESVTVIENLANGDQVRQKRTFTSASEALVVGDVVGLDATGKIYKANPSDPSKMPAAGVVVAVTTTAGDYEVQTAGELTVAGATLTPGKFVWVGPAGLTQNMADVPANGVLQQAGLALTPTNLTLALPGLVVTK